MRETQSPRPVCMAVTAKGHDCGKPAKARVLGNQPVCGRHARAAEQRGEEVWPL